jgi:hypothetical protein
VAAPAAVAAAPKRKVSFGADMYVAREGGGGVAGQRLGSGDDCSEAEEEESIYSEEESGSEAAEDVPATYLWWVGEVARGLSLFGGASSEVSCCNCSVVV